MFFPSFIPYSDIHVSVRIDRIWVWKMHVFMVVIFYYNCRIILTIFSPWMRLLICVFCGLQSICYSYNPGKWLNCNYNVALEDSLMSHGKLGKTFYLNTIMLKYHIFSISVLEKLLPRPLEWEHLGPSSSEILYFLWVAFYWVFSPSSQSCPTTCEVTQVRV